jgi:WD40 repeat protein
MSFALGARTKLAKMTSWIKGLKVDENEGMIFTWSQVKTNFNDINTGKIVLTYQDLTSYEDYITDLILSEPFKYFITSTFFGNIYVWKLQKERKLIHTFKGHARNVCSLMPHPTPTMFISASLDNTIRIWCLNKFQEIYSF